MLNKSAIIRLWWLISLIIVNTLSQERWSDGPDIYGVLSPPAPSGRPNICAGLSEGKNVRDIKNCKSYYQCENGSPIHKNCSGGQLFNYATEKCGERNAVDCFECPKDKILSDIFVPNQCNHFIRCYKNIPTQLTCSDGLYFDRNLEMCNLANDELCPFDVVCPKTIDYPFFIRHRDSCNRYFFCEDGTVVERECPPGLHFNTITNQCDHPDNSGCVI